MALVPPKIYVAGHRGMVGSAIVRTLQYQSHAHVFAGLTNAHVSDSVTKS